jgi:hypothetical protein
MELAQMNRRGFLTGTAGVVSLIYASDGSLIAAVDGFKLTPYRGGHHSWVWNDKKYEYHKAGYRFVHDEFGYAIKRYSTRFPNIPSYLMKKHG